MCVDFVTMWVYTGPPCGLSRTPVHVWSFQAQTLFDLHGEFLDKTAALPSEFLRSSSSNIFLISARTNQTLYRNPHPHSLTCRSWNLALLATQVVADGWFVGGGLPSAGASLSNDRASMLSMCDMIALHCSSFSLILMNKFHTALFDGWSRLCMFLQFV